MHSRKLEQTPKVSQEDVFDTLLTHSRVCKRAASQALHFHVFLFIDLFNYIKQVCSCTSRTYWPLAGTSSKFISCHTTVELEFCFNSCHVWYSGGIETEDREYLSGPIYYPTSNMLSDIVLMLVMHPIVGQRKQNQNIDVYAQNQNQTQRITNFMKIFKGFANVVEKPLIGLEYSQSRSRFVVNVANG